MSEEDEARAEINRYYLTSKGKALVEEIVRLYARGDSIQAVADQLGLTTQHVQVLMAVDANMAIEA